MGIDTAAKKVQINKLVRSQVPSFVAEDNPLFVDFLKQYYISEENKGKSIDIITNFNDYQKAETYSETYNLIGWQTVDIYQNVSITYLSSIKRNQKLKKEIFKLPQQN